MNIELGSIVSAVGSVASGIGKASAEVGKGGPAFEAAPSMALPTPTPDLGGIFKPASELAFTKPLVNAKPIGEIVFNPLKEADAVAEAESIVSQAQAKPTVKPQTIKPVEMAILSKLVIPSEELKVVPIVDNYLYDRTPYCYRPNRYTLIRSYTYAELSSALSPVLDPETKTENALGIQSATEPVNQQKTEPLVDLSLEQQQAQKVAKKEKVTRKQTEQVEKAENRKRKRFVVDRKTLIKRLRELGLAIPKAKLEAKRLGYGTKLIGSILEKVLSLGQPEDLSKIVRPQGPDGTLAIIRDAIKAKKELSEKEAEEVVLNNRPVSEEEGGEPVAIEEVRKVTQDRWVKPAEATELVEERISKKVIQLPEQRSTFVVVKAPVKTGTTIENLGLAEVFSKAA